MVELWERVALESHSCVLRVGKAEVISSYVIGSHGDAIHHLDLPCQVVAPASLWQIRREHEAYFLLQSPRAAPIKICGAPVHTVYEGKCSSFLAIPENHRVQFWHL